MASQGDAWQSKECSMEKSDPNKKKSRRKRVDVSSSMIHPDFDSQDEYVDYLRERLKGRGEL